METLLFLSVCIYWAGIGALIASGAVVPAMAIVLVVSIAASKLQKHLGVQS